MTAQPDRGRFNLLDVCLGALVDAALVVVLVAELALLVDLASVRDPDLHRPAPSLAYLATCPVLP